MRKNAVPLIGTGVIGIALRWASLSRESLWFDEAISQLAAGLPLSDLFSNAIRDPHPPFYYGLLRVWLDFTGGSDSAARWLSVIFGVMLIAAVYLLAAELLGNRRFALISAALVAISPFQVLYSQEVRMYSLQMFLAVMVGLSYMKARRSSGRGWWALLTAFAAMAAYSHLFSALVLAAAGTHALLSRDERHGLQGAALAGLGVALLLSPWLILLASETSIGSGSLRPLIADAPAEFNPIKLLTTLSFLLFGQSFAGWQVAISLFLILSIAVVSALEMRKVWRGEGRGQLLLPVLMVGFVVGVPVIIYMIRPFFLPERTMAAAAPFMIVLLSWGMSRRRTPLPYLVGLAGVWMLVSTVLYLTGDPIKPPYREAIRFVEAQRQERDVTLHTSDGSYLPALTYVDFADHALLAGDPGMRKPDGVYQKLGGTIWTIDQATAGRERLWLIIALEHSIEWQQEQAAYFAEHFTPLEAHDFGGIQVILYDLSP